MRPDVLDTIRREVYGLSIPERSTIVLEVAQPLPTGQEPPTEWHLLPLGDIKARWRGGGEATFTVDAEAIAAVMDNYRRRGHDLSIDYNHKQVRGGTDHEMRSAGSFDLEARADGLWMTNIQWTADAEGYVRRREYRYFSPSFDALGGRIVELHNVALTASPATLGIRPLVADATPPSEAGEETELDPTLIGLSADTPPTQVALRAVALNNFEATVLGLTGTTEREAAVTQIEAALTSAAQAATLAQRVQDLEAASEAAERETLLSNARQAGTLTPAQCAEGGWARDVQLDVLRSFLATAAPVVPVGQFPEASVAEPEPVAAPSAQLNADIRRRAGRQP